MTDTPPSADPVGADTRYRALRARVAGTNINPETLLATDYLNHFNEVVMLLELMADMPELLEEAKAWRPKSYPDHFRDSTVVERELAIESYLAVPARFKEPFERTIDQINRLIATTIERFEHDLAAGDTALARENRAALSQVIQRLMDVASGIIHGGDATMDQTDVDTVIGTPPDDA